MNDIITNEPSYIELQLFLDDPIHLPFHLITHPADKTVIIVKRFYKDKVNQYEVDNKYQYHFSDLLKSQGITIKDNKYIIEK